MTSPRDDQWPRESWMDAIATADPPLSHGQRLVAYAYYRLARDRRYAWVTTDRLMKETGMKERSCSRSRQQVLALGWLTEIQAADNRHAAHLALTIPDSARSDPESALEVQTRPSVPPDPTLSRVQTRPSVGQSNPDKSISNLSANQLALQGVLRCAEDDERLAIAENLAVTHSVRSMSSWLRRVAASGDLDTLIAEELAATTKPAKETFWDRHPYAHLTPPTTDWDAERTKAAASRRPRHSNPKIPEGW